MAKIKINSGSGAAVIINKPGAGKVVKISRPIPPDPDPDPEPEEQATYPIEYKSVSDDYATAINIAVGVGEVVYTYLDENDNEITGGTLEMDTDRSMSAIKDDVFTALSLTDLLPIEFTFPTVANYVAFGNPVHLGNQAYAWDGRRGGNHLGNGRICHQPYNSLNRTFGTRTVISRTLGEDLRGGSHTAYNGQLYFFSSLYLTDTDEFVSLTLNKSTDLNGGSWTESTILYAAGTNGGVNETTYARFNFYGTPQFVGNDTWIIPWYEHNGAGTWRPNFLKSTDNLQTFTTHNISQSSVNKIGETDICFVGNDTLIALGRQDANAPLMQNVSTDLGDTWSGWVVTNLGSSSGRCMAGLNYSQEHGLMVVYGDRGTGNIMITLNNDLETIIANPTGYSTPQILHTVEEGDDYQPLCYGSIKRVAQYRFMITISEELTGGATTKLFIGDGSLKDYE